MTKRSDGKGRVFAAAVLDQAFLKAAPGWQAAAPYFELSLHDGDPEDAAGRLANEVDYPDYARPRLPRDLLTWIRKGNAMTNRVEARFALCQRGEKRNATHWALTPHGETAPAYRGAFASPLVIEPGVRPVVDPGMIEVTEG